MTSRESELEHLLADDTYRIMGNHLTNPNSPTIPSPSQPYVRNSPQPQQPRTTLARDQPNSPKP
eukprot:1943984-Amphidinium_carterae.1